MPALSFDEAFEFQRLELERVGALPRRKYVKNVNDGVYIKNVTSKLHSNDEVRGCISPRS